MEAWQFADSMQIADSKHEPTNLGWVMQQENGAKHASKISECLEKKKRLMVLQWLKVQTCAVHE